MPQGFSSPLTVAPGRRPRRSGVAAVLVSVLLSGCFDTDTGPSPPPEEFYYPTGLVVSPGGRALYVANSDFDLQYSAGTIQAIDLDRLRAMVNNLLVERPLVGDDGQPLLDSSGQPRTTLRVDCAMGGLGPNRAIDAILYPGECAPIDLTHPPRLPGDLPDEQPASLIRSTVEIGAFATNIRFQRQPPPLASGVAEATRARLLLPVRGDPSLTWIDVDDDTNGAPQSFRLECGQGSSRRCDDNHRSGIDPATNKRELTLPSEPFELAVSDPGDAMVMTHQTSGAVSLLLSGWPENNPPPTPATCAPEVDKPTLEFVYGGLPTQVSGVVALPTPRRALLGTVEEGTARAYAPGFIVGYRDAAQLNVLRYINDCNSEPRRPYLALSSGTPIALTAGGVDSRSIAVDPSAMRACEATCGDANLTCLDQCAGIPVGLYVASRAPSSLLGGSLVNEVATLSQLTPLPEGASRVEIGQIIDRQGQRQTRVFVVSFDAKRLTVYNPATRKIEKQMTTGRGPSALAFDTAEGSSFGYLAYFTDSYLSVIDLDMRHSTYLSLIANVGRPEAPRESQ